MRSRFELLWFLWASFLIENGESVREGILFCGLWLPAVEPMLGGWLAVLQKQRLLFYPPLALLMVPGWHNHSFFVERIHG